MPGNLKAGLLEGKNVLQVLRVAARLAAGVAISNRTQCPDCNRRPEAYVAKEMIDQPAGLKSLAIGIVKDRKREPV